MVTSRLAYPAGRRCEGIVTLQFGFSACDSTASQLQIRVVGDEACAPELRPVALEGIAGKHSRSVSGWIKQQVVKLACSFTIQVCVRSLAVSRSCFAWLHLAG